MRGKSANKIAERLCYHAWCQSHVQLDYFSTINFYVLWQNIVIQIDLIQHLKINDNKTEKKKS